MYYSVLDIMKILNVCRNTAVRFIKSELPYIYAENEYGKLLVKVEDFDRWREAHGQKTSM